tara:strand:- start:53 stop:571 length:519 start_codon:yes stop_codon:yes gene_type:complete
MKIDIVDDFLSSYHADMYEKIFNGMNRGLDDFQWYFSNNLNGKFYLGNYYFNNNVFSRVDNVNNQNLMHLFDSILFKLQVPLDRLWRIKVNLYPRTQFRVHHFSHTDYEPNIGLRTCLYYVNTNNGMTVFDGKKKIRSKKNRAILFDGSNTHHSTTPTDVNYRCSINIDYML